MNNEVDFENWNKIEMYIHINSWDIYKAAILYAHTITQDILISSSLVDIITVLRLRRTRLHSGIMSLHLLSHVNRDRALSATAASVKCNERKIYAVMQRVSLILRSRWDLRTELDADAYEEEAAKINEEETAIYVSHDASRSARRNRGAPFSRAVSRERDALTNIKYIVKRYLSLIRLPRSWITAACGSAAHLFHLKSAQKCKAAGIEWIFSLGSARGARVKFANNCHGRFASRVICCNSLFAFSLH